jgi:hypothetical protein
LFLVKAIVRRFHEEIVNTGNVDLIESLVSPEYTEVHEGKRHAIGIEGTKGMDAQILAQMLPAGLSF